MAAEVIPPGCACEWVSTDEVLFPEVNPDEIDALGRVSRDRLIDFAAGRQASRSAQLRLGLVPRPVLVGSRGEPCWPSGLVGSITHSGGFAGAAVAKRSERCSLGIDLAEVASVSIDVWPIIFTSAEIEVLSGLPLAKQPESSATIFSAKESFFKVQYPLTKRWVDFTDANVVLDQNGVLQLQLAYPLLLNNRLQTFFSGRYIVHGSYAFTYFEVLGEVSR